MQAKETSLSMAELENFLCNLPLLESKQAQNMAADLKMIRESADLPEIS